MPGTVRLGSEWVSGASATGCVPPALLFVADCAFRSRPSGFERGDRWYWSGDCSFRSVWSWYESRDCSFRCVWSWYEWPDCSFRCVWSWYESRDCSFRCVWSWYESPDRSFRSICYGLGFPCWSWPDGGDRVRRTSRGMLPIAQASEKRVNHLPDADHVRCPLACDLLGVDRPCGRSTRPCWNVDTDFRRTGVAFRQPIPCFGALIPAGHGVGDVSWRPSPTWRHLYASLRTIARTRRVRVLHGGPSSHGESVT